MGNQENSNLEPVQRSGDSLKLVIGISSRGGLRGPNLSPVGSALTLGSVSIAQQDAQLLSAELECWLVWGKCPHTWYQGRCE